jgi:hypothetical protein
MDMGTLTADQFSQQQINRQQRMAEMLMQQGMQQPQGQMISGRYVAPSITQNLAGLANVYMGQRGLEKAEKAQVDLADRLRRQTMQDIQAYGQAARGTPEQTVYGAGMEGPTMDVTPAVAPNPERALGILMGSRSPQSQALAQALLADQMKTLVLPEGSTAIRGTLGGVGGQTIQGAEKFRAPIQVDTGTSIEFRDAKDPTKVLQVVPKSQAGQVVEREDGTFLVDTRTGVAKPVVGQQGQTLVGGKPLTEAQGNSVAFGARALEANKIATELENKGFRNTGAIRTAVGGFVGMTPFVGEQLEQGVRSTFNVAPTFLGGTNEEQQQVEQARRNFVSAVLRKESGAAIGVDEYKNEERKYFPQAGDTDKVIKQKQKARELAIEALKAQAGPSGVRQINQIVNAQLSPQDQEALSWANSNPNDPRSAQIKQRLGR